MKKLKSNEKKAILSGLLFMIYIFTRAFRVEQYLGDTLDLVFSIFMLLLILYLILPFSKIISSTKSMYCKSFGK